ncbi:hypothetical protein [Ruania zhangjianzhongii]|uniref:hypothetical protein n=1 Tax=Ruania zhangjianzhongii TaxID=2603206 RepID=UPI0011CA9486|nr:hypothetical protein [Ruania zhangjianzhongii]
MSSYDPPSYNPNAFVAPPPGGGNRSTNVPGRIALIVGVALTLLQLARILVIWSMPMDVGGGSDGLWRAVDLGFTVGEAVLAVLAVITGAVGLAGRPRPRGAAAAGLALGTSTLLFLLLNVTMPLIYQ